MATIMTDLICNLNQPVAATFLHGNLFSQDNAGNTINVHVMDNGEPATIGGTVFANVIRADGNTVAVSGAIEGNKAYVILPQACYAVPGRVEIIIKLTQSTTITTIAAIVANVYRSTTDTVVDPGTIIPSIQTLIEEIEEAVDSIPVDYSGLLATIAADYSSSKTYPVVGMYAWQGGVLKRNIVPITTAETYTAAHWTNAVLGDDVSDLKSAFDVIGYAKKEFALTAGEQHLSTKDVCDVDIKEGQVFTIALATNPAGAVSRSTVYAYNTDGTSTELVSKVNFDVKSTFTATKYIRGIGCFSSATQIVNNCTMSVQVYIKDRIADDVNILKSDVPAIKTELGAYEFTGQSDSVESWVTKTTNAVTNNNDGTFSIGTNDYGTIIFKLMHLLPGNYKIYGVPSNNGYSFLSTGTNYSTAFVSNTTGSEMLVTIEQEQDCYLGFRNGSRPSTGYTITPFLIEDRIVSINNSVRNIVLENGKTVTTTVLGADLPSGASAIFNLTDGYITVLKTAVDAWMSEYAGDVQKVPFILHTDQHGRLKSTYKGLFDLLNYLVNWDEISAIFNLGDTVTNNYVGTSGIANPLLRCAELETAMKCLANIPKEKQINMWGNHDSWYSGDIETPVAGTLPDMKYLNPYFIATGLRTVRQGDNSNLQIVYDDRNRIKYLCVADWDYANRGSSSQYAYTLFWISAEHWKWIIDEMAKNEGYSLVLVSHVPLLMGSELAYDPITNASRTKSTPELIVTERPLMNAVWTARKNKTSGSITVKDETVNYDFTGCTDDCLCAISGHTHYDGVDYIGGTDGLLQVAFDWFTNYTVHFGLIDIRNRKIKAWKVSNDDNTPLVQNWEAPFDYQAT